MLQVYKALHNIDDIKWHDMFSLATNQTRGHSLKLSKKRCNSTQRLHSFSFRIVDLWNSLPQETVSARTVNSFRPHLNDTDWNVKKFNPTYRTAQYFKSSIVLSVFVLLSIFRYSD